MYVIWEYLTIVVVVGVVSGLLFLATALFVITEEGAERLAESSHQAAAHALQKMNRQLNSDKPIYSASPPHSQ